MNLYRLLKQRAEAGRPVRVGTIGAGKFGTMFLAQARLTPGMQIVGVATRHPEKAKESCMRAQWPEEALAFGETTDVINDEARRGKIVLTSRPDQLLQADLDVIIELTGSPEAGARHAWQAMDAGKHVIMVNVEADVLLGPALKKKANQKGLIYSMGYGDQPALICELLDWVHAVGLEIVCAGKGTRYQPEYNYSTPETVWGHYGFSEERVATGDYNPQMFNSFLDGTKSAIEMCAVANASGLIPQKCGLQFPPVGADNLADVLKPKSAGGILEHSGTLEVLASEDRDKNPVPRDLRWGVYVVFRAPTDYVKRCYSEYGMHTDSSGEYSAMYRPYHLIGLELGISAASVVLRGEPTGSTESFVADVASTAKKDLKPGDVLDGEGGYTVFGSLTRAEDSAKNGYLPIGLSGKAKMIRPVAKGSILSYDDVEIDDTLFSHKLRKMVEEDYKKTH